MIVIPESGELQAFAMIVDINSFSPLVKRYEMFAAQFTHDNLYGHILTVEKHGGEVVGLMGDAFYALLPDHESVAMCCIDIAISVNKTCEYLYYAMKGIDDYPRGYGLKIGVEYGYLNTVEIETRAMGNQRLFIGEPVIYAARICQAGRGNRCVFGPKAADLIGKSYTIEGPYTIKGKRGEPPYTYYKFNLSEIWLEGSRSRNGGRWYVD